MWSAVRRQPKQINRQPQQIKMALTCSAEGNQIQRTRRIPPAANRVATANRPKVRRRLATGATGPRPAKQRNHARRSVPARSIALRSPRRSPATSPVGAEVQPRVCQRPVLPQQRQTLPGKCVPETGRRCGWLLDQVALTAEPHAVIRAAVSRHAVHSGGDKFPAAPRSIVAHRLPAARRRRPRGFRGRCGSSRSALVGWRRCGGCGRWSRRTSL